MSADVEQRADYGAYHVAQEAVRRNGEYQQPVVLPLPSGAGNAAQVRFIVRVQLAKTGEILFSRQQGCGFVHAAQIERPNFKGD